VEKGLTPHRDRGRPLETEVVLLKAVKEIIDSIVNPEILEVLGQDPNSVIRFHTSSHQRLFNIVLVDFLSATDVDKQAPVRQKPYMDWLRSIVDRPAFNIGNSIESLDEATAQFKDWLEQEVEVVTWFPSIEVERLLKLSRLDYLKMCGDISKHNFLRAIRVAKKLRGILAKSGVPVQLDDALMALSDFYKRFHRDKLNYDSSTIAEFLNNIRWGIYEYLHPEFKRSIVREGGDPPKYRYTYPDEVATRFAKECYWNLMNEVREPPYIRKFRVTKYLKLR
jgi:hypothetical protein